MRNDTAQPVVAVAGDPGGAAALAPVLQRMVQNARLSLRAFGYRDACGAWQGAGFDFTSIPDTADQAWLSKHLDGAALLLTATSVNGLDWERRAIGLANQMQIPSLALLDFWSNYRRRFEDDRGCLRLPDQIAVMDELARAEMIALGFPAESLAVTGQPVFDDLRDRRNAFNTERRRKLRGAAGVGDDELLVLYASQPFADLYGGLAQARATLGYDEVEVHALCSATLAQLARLYSRKIVMAIRRHPRESGDLPDVPRTNEFRAISWQAPDRLDAALASDLVLGMNSMFLMEAVLLGQIVVSVQPGLRGPDPLPSNRDGRSCVVTDPNKLAPTLETALFDAPWRERHLINLRSQALSDGATENVLAVAERLIAQTKELHEHR